LGGLERDRWKEKKASADVVVVFRPLLPPPLPFSPRHPSLPKKKKGKNKVVCDDDEIRTRALTDQSLNLAENRLRWKGRAEGTRMDEMMKKGKEGKREGL